MAGATRATQALDRAGVRYVLRRYHYEPGTGRVGLQAADALGVDPGTMLKTLMLLADGKPACAILPADREASPKRVARALGTKTVAMMTPAQAERLTGYKIGGISPFGQRRPVPMLVEDSVLALPEVFVNGGQRGLQLLIDPRAILDVAGATAASIMT